MVAQSLPWPQMAKTKIISDYITKYRLEILNLAKFYYTFSTHIQIKKV